MSTTTKILAACALGLAGVALAKAAGATSLYSENKYQALAADRRAIHAGDLLTVMITENASATSTANTTSGRNGSVSLDLERPSKSIVGGFSANNQLTGGGQTQRADTVVAQMTVTVLSVNANGDLIIAGEQTLDVNSEHQRIKVEGRVRPQDVDATNTISSTRIADAKISYVGSGDLSDTQRAGLWQRVMTWFGL